MLGRSHAASGAATWLGSCAAAAALGHRPSAVTVVVGGVTCAGFALLPDLDHPESLVSGTFGPATRGLARLVERAAAAVRAATAAPQDQPSRGGHRTLTHTAVFAVAVGLLVAAVAGLASRWGVGLVVFAATGLALRGLLPARDRYAAGPLALAAISAGVGLACAWLPDGHWWWLGLPAGLGCLAHCLGDSLTHTGVPLLWPIPVAGQRWYRVGTPQVLRFTTGGGVESWLVGPLLLALGGLFGWWTLGL